MPLLADSPAPRRISWLASGLFLITLSTLMLEVLDTRLLSVITWYHLSFLAVSVAMLGMAAGAVIVFAGQDFFAPERAVRLLPHTALAFAGSVAISHAANLSIPFPTLHMGSPTELVALGMAILVLTVPFILSGIVVTLALTRTGGPIGWLYGADLIGAAMGCLVIILLLEFTDITSTALAAAGVAALGAWCFAKHTGSQGRAPLALAVLLLAATGVNAAVDPRLGILYPKSRSLWGAIDTIAYSEWNAHSNVIVRRPTPATPFYWGAAANAPQPAVTTATAAIDGDAGTVITEWDGDPASLDWVRYDVTTLPYRLRSGEIAVIGVGGGRDVLSAIQAGNSRVTGIEINGALVRAHTGPYRDFARIATHPGVTLVHDEARSYLTRVPGRFDVVQMSLIDTWAATGAGAFTLSENGLYTREGWRVFLRALKPDGVFSVSRWFDPNAASETTRLLSLGVASLIDAGVADPRQHLMLVTRERIATLLVSRSPFTPEDAARIERTTQGMDFTVLAAPWQEAADPRIRRILESRSLDALFDASADRYYDFTPPTDRRPFFFNMLKPGGFLVREGSLSGGVVSGNLRATRTLIALAVIAAVLVLAIIGAPLVLSGRPRTSSGVFGAGLLYFGIIGFAFMLIQIPFLQRFSVYLGHPTYTFSIILFLMILSAGLGSIASERIDTVRSRGLAWLPVGIGGAVLVEMLLLQPAIDATVAWGLAGRTAIVAAFVSPLAFCLGYCFPIGMRCLGRHSETLTAWMWGVNGACGVMASIVAVMISMWIGIHTNLLVAAFLYLLLAVPLRALRAQP
jgi:SAM-dependent methyltransferase